MQSTFFRMICLAAVLAVMIPGATAQERFEVYTYQDSQTNTWAFQLLIPQGWQFSGGISWLPQPFKITETRFAVYAPGNVAGYEYYPDYMHVWSNNRQIIDWYGQQMPVSQPMSAVELLQNSIIPNYRSDVQNLQVLKATPMPELAKRYYQAALKQAEADSVFAQLMGGAQFSYDVGRVDVSYEYNGYKFFETFMVRVIYTQAPGGVAMFWGPEELTSFWCEYQDREAMMDKYIVMASSMQLNPVFMHKLYQINLMMLRNQQQQIASIGDLSRYISQTYDEISQMVTSSMEYRNQVYDKAFADYSEYVRGVESFHDGQVQVEVPLGYSHVWRNGDQVIISDNPNYNPNQHLQGSWGRMQQGRPGGN